MLKRTGIIMIAILLLLLASCGRDNIDVSAYADVSIELSGLTPEDQLITAAELKELEAVTVTTHSTSEKIGTVRATGPTLATVCEKYGQQLSDFSRIYIYGSDKYGAPFPRSYLEEHDLILAYGIDGKPLTESDIPARLIICKSDSAYWVKRIIRIEFYR